MERKRKWTRAQTRPGGAGIKVYVPGRVLKKAFDGPVPEPLLYRVLIDKDYFNAVIIDLQGEDAVQNGR